MTRFSGCKQVADPMFDTVLIANRGEIAHRIQRACRQLGLRTVAVYSEADAGWAYLKSADQAICIGPASPQRSYLNQAAILLAAEVSGAQAIHPGYGFLSENAKFAEQCESCNIKFIGPKSKSIKMMAKSADHHAAENSSIAKPQSIAFVNTWVHCALCGGSQPSRAAQQMHGEGLARWCRRLFQPISHHLVNRKAYLPSY